MPNDAATNPQATLDRGATAGAPDTAAEHLAHLHKMSTTAGVTNQDYVAVNTVAIVAAVLGLASGLAFFGWLMLVVPLAGIVFAVVAIRQINDSSGTQTGKGLAMIGLALCVGCAGGMMVQRLLQARAVRADERAISDRISRAGRLIQSGDYKQAYAQFDDQFHSKFPLERFGQTWENIQSSSVGKVQIMEWNGVRPVFESAQGMPKATAVMRLKFQNGNEERYEVILRKPGDQWLINGLPQFFKEQRGQQRKPADDFNL